MSDTDKFEDALRAFAEVLRGDVAPAATPPTAQPAAPEAPAAATPAPAVAPQIPTAPLVPAPVAVAARGPQPPPGKAPLTVADLSTISQAEAVARMDEIEALERQEQNQRRAS